MKKIIALTVVFIMAVSLAAGCSKTVSDDKTTGPKKVSASEALDISEIELSLPEFVDGGEWYVFYDENGNALDRVQVDFEYDGVKICYAAEHTDKTEAYNFSGLDAGKNPNTQTMETEYMHYYMEYNDNVGYVMWINTENGICYNMFTEELNEECDLTFVADNAYFSSIREQWEAEHPFDGESDPEEEEIPATNIAGIYKYDNEDSYIYISHNFTYTVYGADGITDGKLRFWKFKEDADDSKVLLDESGNEWLTVTLVGEWYDETISDSDGNMLKRADFTPDGRYHCEMDGMSFAEEGQIYMMPILDFWYSDTEVGAMDIGGIIRLGDDDMFDIEITDIEKKDDQWMVVNGEMNLKYDAEACAWKLYDHNMTFIESAGIVKLSDDVKFTDTLDGDAHSTIAECVDANGTVYCNAVVENSTVTEIEVLPFD